MSSPSPLTNAAEERFWLGIEAAGRFFMGEADVQKALEKLVRTLDAHGISYAIIGAMALNEFGYRRTTVDVDVLLTPEGLAAFKKSSLGRGYVERFPGSRSVRDTEHGVDIDIVLAGSYPGDGKPKPVAFPDPTTAAERGARVALLPLPRLLELKLASGHDRPSSPQRPRRCSGGDSDPPPAASHRERAGRVRAGQVPRAVAGRAEHPRRVVGFLA